jgi:hypothetical protein
MSSFKHTPLSKKVSASNTQNVFSIRNSCLILNLICCHHSHTVRASACELCIHPQIRQFGRKQVDCLSRRLGEHTWSISSADLGMYDMILKAISRTNVNGCKERNRKLPLLDLPPVCNDKCVKCEENRCSDFCSSQSS